MGRGVCVRSVVGRQVVITVGALAIAVPSPLHAPGWYIAAGLLVLAAVFHEWIRRSLLAFISAASARVQDRLAGSVLISSYAIGRYRAARGSAKSFAVM
jgi:hypothetical protein